MAVVGNHQQGWHCSSVVVDRVMSQTGCRGLAMPSGMGSPGVQLGTEACSAERATEVRYRKMPASPNRHACEPCCAKS